MSQTARSSSPAFFWNVTATYTSWARVGLRVGRLHCLARACAASVRLVRHDGRSYRPLMPDRAPLAQRDDPGQYEETSQGHQRPLREGGNGHAWEGRRGAARAAAGPARSERDLVVVQCHRACSRQGPPYQVRAADQRDARLRENVSGKLTARANRRGAPNPPLHAAGVATVGEHHVAGGREGASSYKHPDGTRV